MKNNELLSNKLRKALDYLYKQEEELKPFLQYLSNYIVTNIAKEKLSVKDAFEMFTKIQSQYTDSILLITKIKEIIDFKL